MNGVECRDVQELAAELALGLVAGGERATALAHLAGCRECRRLVEELSQAADGLLLLAPVRAAPLGFESRVLRAVGRGRPWWRSPTAAAAAVALVAGVAVAAVVFDDDDGVDPLTADYVAALRALDGEALVAGRLRDTGGREVGDVFAYEGRTPWLFVSVTESTGDADLEIELRFEDGQPLRVAGFHLRGGQGAMGVNVSIDVETLRSVALVDVQGDTRYRVALDHPDE